MQFQEFKLQNLGIDKAAFGRVATFIDFGNVNFWYEHDERDEDGKQLAPHEKLIVDLEKLAHFVTLFSENTRFYFGLDQRHQKSIHIIRKGREYFDKAVTKPVQYIKHYLQPGEAHTTTRAVNQDRGGHYIYIPKCNFDVEICIDAVRLLNLYDTFCLLSSDADFAYLVEFLKRRDKQFILISAGYVSHWLKDKADLNINSQQIKKEIVIIKTLKSRR